MKKTLSCIVLLVSLFIFSPNTFASISINFDTIVNGSFELEGTSEDSLSFQIIGANYLNGSFKLTAEYGFGKTDSSFEFTEIQAGFILFGGGVEINDANAYLTVSQIKINEENDDFSVNGTAFGLCFLQAHPVEASGAFYIDQITVEFAPKATYKKYGAEPYNDVSILVGSLKARYQFTSNLSGIFGYRLYFVNLDSTSTELNGFSLGIKYKFQ